MATTVTETATATGFARDDTGVVVLTSARPAELGEGMVPPVGAGSAAEMRVIAAAFAGGSRGEFQRRLAEFREEQAGGVS